LRDDVVPFSRYISAAPFRARLFDSVAPLVKMISSARVDQPAIWAARSPPLPGGQPNEWLRLAALPELS